MVVMSPDRHRRVHGRAGCTTPSAVEVAPDGKIYLPTPTPTWCGSTASRPVRRRTRPLRRVRSPRRPPAARSTVGPVTITGTATDNQALGTRVRRAEAQRHQHLAADERHVRRASRGCRPRWPTRARPRATWSFSTTLPATGGYFMQLRVDDGAGNQNATPEAEPDLLGGRRAVTRRRRPGRSRHRRTTRPVPAPVTITGTAADDKGVASVKLGIRQNGTNLWWNGTAWRRRPTKVNAVLGTPGRHVDHLELHAQRPCRRAATASRPTSPTPRASSRPGTGKPTWRNFTVTG